MDSPEITLPTEQGAGILSRLQSARARHGPRMFAVLLYRSLFQWPRLRSAAVRLKLSALMESRIAPTARFGKHVFVSIPGGRLVVGERTQLMERCYIELGAEPQAELRIGADCFIAHDVHIGTYRRIVIGNDVRIAEFTSLRDFSHYYKDRNRTITRQGDLVGTLTIGDDVWIGKGCTLLAEGQDITIGRGAVVGAHSIVKESVPDYAIVVGSPARIVGYRSPE